MKRTAATALTALVLAAALTACGSDDSTNAAPKKKTPATAPGVPSAKGTAGAEASAGIPPKPDAAMRLAYIRALTGIDPDIVHGKEDKAVDRGRNQCQTIHNFPKDTSKQARMAEMRFTSPKHPQGFGKVKAAQIVVAVHTNLCPKF
ncbi:hypothetical protein RM550_31675 [Streptomyces sp. DSM 41527]|uniref:DUF732 domain-containing protein n=1 Tax=Streptomyces mooreae TaxID=3075523 RepID=A0ABU2TH53_9ACTN|nr:hypothetical protein [Streptomyces sp. DSM 41527]MDT0460230.1 hypothetical protein [Streptomyces sp. DSM 41527]